MGIRESALSTLSALTNNDFIRMVSSAGASRKATLQAIAQHIIETYAGSSLAGSNQSVKAAIDGLNSNLTGSIKRITVTVGDVTIGSGGYLNIKSYYPGGQTGYEFLHAEVFNVGIVSTKDAVTVLGNGNYLLGTGGASITSLVIAYYYAKNLVRVDS